MKIRALMLMVAMLGLSLAVSAQSSRGTVSGTVTDPTGAVISGATVTLTNIATTVERTTVTNDEGFYRFDAIDPGNYSIKFTASGFGEVVKTNVPVQGGQTQEVNAPLAPGGQQITVDVTAEGTALLQTEAPVRGGNIETRRITELPYVGRNPVALALTLPGVSTNRGSQGVGTFSVNGARGRSNNFLIDGTENNDISVAGQGFQIGNPDAVQEVSIQTSNFDAEYGRAGGAVVNVITKGGTNDFHGTVSFLYDTMRDDAISPLQSRNPEVILKGRNLSATQYIASGTIGGPVILPGYDGHNRTFFFGSYQQDRARSTAAAPLVTPTAAGRATLASIFGTSSPNLNAYLDATSATIGTSDPFFIGLGLAGTVTGSDVTCSAAGVPATGNRGCVQFGTFQRVYGATWYNPQWQTRVDHKISDNDQLSGRFLWDRQYQPLGGQASFPGFDADYAGRLYNFLVTETHIFSPTTTNELRLGYNRLQFGFPIQDASGPAGSIPAVTIQGSGITANAGTAAFGVPATFPQGRIANNYVIQDTVTHIRGDHTFRLGVDYLRQISTQEAPSNQRGSLTYSASTTNGARSSLANFIEDFGGTAGTASRDFGTGIYHPQLTRIAFFLQDRWKVTEALTLTLGVRYENFGTPFNALRTSAFTGLFNTDPATRTGPFSEPNSVHHDQNNWSPAFGIAYSPSVTDGFMARLVGDKKTVFRAGFQIGYDSFFNNIASNAQASSPNLIVTTTNSTNSNGPRGLANLSSNFPLVAAPLSPLSGQTLINPRLVNPYYIRWSAGLQRSLPYNLILDMSYVGTRGVKLFLQEDYNPLVPTSLRVTPPGTNTSVIGLSGRLDNLQGTRTVRGNGGESKYHAAQIEVRRRFADNFTFTGAYTWSKFLDNGSEIFGNTTGSNSPAQAVPSLLAPNGLDNEWAVSNFDRPHRASFTYVYELPWFREQRGVLGHVLGGFQIAGVTTFESGVPFTVFNNVDADQLGGALDRPLYNPLVNNNVRAVPSIATAASNPCSVAVGATYYRNPDSGNACINPADAEYIGLLAGTGAGVGQFGNAPRNSERSPGINNTNLNIMKRTRISENKAVEFRVEFYNVFNHPQFVQSPSSILANVFGSLGTGISSVVTGGVAGRFLQPDTATTDAATRVIRYQIKFIF
jgi:outer membrane receptor protein involved in Fe transport